MASRAAVHVRCLRRELLSKVRTASPDILEDWICQRHGDEIVPFPRFTKCAVQEALDYVGDVTSCESCHLYPTPGCTTNAPLPHIEMTPEGQSLAANAEADQLASPSGGPEPAPAEAQVVIPVEKACATSTQEGSSETE